eukprot:6055125-Alexandrium_andersonii.AAC.1
MVLRNDRSLTPQITTLGGPIVRAVGAGPRQGARAQARGVARLRGLLIDNPQHGNIPTSIAAGIVASFAARTAVLYTRTCSDNTPKKTRGSAAMLGDP